MRGRLRRALPNLFGALGSAVLVVGTVFVALAPIASANTSAYTANDYFGATHTITGNLSGQANQNPTTGAFAPCKNGTSTSVNCNIYSNKNGVWLNSGPAAATLGTGRYFFVVLVPSTQATPNDSTSNTKNLSFQAGDPWTNREFTVTNGTVTYPGTHARDTTNTRIQLMPYANTTNTGGEYVLDLCRVPNPLLIRTGTGAPGASSSACKKDNFKVATPTLTTPTLTTTASGTVAVGTAIHDTATLSGGSAPTGTITFSLFSTSSCTTPVTAFGTAGTGSTAGVAVNGDNTYASATFTPTVAGTYYWTAAYSGDTKNRAVGETCGATHESSVVNKVTPALSTTASGPVTVGTAIFDTAHLTGGYDPTGTITFSLFSTSSCKTAVAAFGSTGVTPGVGVTGAGTYRSAAYTTTAVGTYYWVASYSGDPNNNGVTGTCNAPTESSKVNKASPTLPTTASGPVTVGSNIHDTATLSGGYDPTGTITFTLYRTSSCKTQVTSSHVSVTGNGRYASGTVTTTAAGTYYWVASYSGDANNTAVTSPCNSATESSKVNKASPTLVTHASGPVKVGSPILKRAKRRTLMFSPSLATF